MTELVLSCFIIFLNDSILKEFVYILATATELFKMGASPQPTTLGEPAFELGELQSRSPHADVNDGQAARQEFSLPPVDTGKDAWLFLAACWVVEAVTFGEYCHTSETQA